MKRIFTLLSIILMASAGTVYACEALESFQPEVKFQLEDSTFRETMAWTSGWGYALTAYIQDAKANGDNPTICLCKGDVVSSKVILAALNEEFSGKTITADQAMPVIWRAIKSHYHCD